MRHFALTWLAAGLVFLAGAVRAGTGGLWDAACQVTLSNTNNDTTLPHHACRSSQAAYLACDLAGLRVFALSNVCPPAELGWYSPPNIGRAVDVAVWDSRVLTAFEFGGAHLLNLSNRARPLLESVITCPGEPDGAASVALVKGWALVTAGIETVHLYDVETRGRCVWMSTYNTGPPGGSYTGLVRAFDTNTAFVACYRIGAGNEVQVVDLSRPAAPAQLAAMRTAGACVEMARAASRLYVMDSRARLYTYDLSDLARPVALGTNTLQGAGTGLFAEESSVYATASVSGFMVLSDQHGTLAATDSFPITDSRAVYAAGALAWVADSSSLRLFRRRPAPPPPPPLWIHEFFHPPPESGNTSRQWHVSFTNRVSDTPKTYVLQAAESLGNPGGGMPAAVSWVAIASNTAAGPGVMTFVNPAEGPQRFYRVVEQE